MDLNINGKEIKIRKTLADHVVGYFSPVSGVERLKARAQMAVFGAYSGGYTTSRTRRSLSGWQTKNLDADSALLPDLPQLRDDCNDLARKNPIAVGAINTVCTNVVGTGLRYHAQIDAAVLGLTEDEADAWESNAEREFALWAEDKRSCDITGQLNFYELQELSLRSVLENGDLFILLPFIERAGCVYGTKLQLIEAARVCNPDSKSDSEKIAGGVERDLATGEPIKYHIAKYHPGNLLMAKNQKWDNIDAYNPEGRRNILHIFKQLRVGQSRGVPYLAPVIEPLKQLGRYTEAELAAAVVAACFTVFLKTQRGDGTINTIVSDDGSGSSSAGGNNSGYKLVEGGVVELGAGDEISTANPGRPNSLFDPFTTSILRQIGVALEIPYEVLIKHFLASYSAARASLLEAWKFFVNKRVFLANNLCQPVLAHWMYEAVASGRIVAPGFFDDPIIRDAYLGSVWTGPARGMIDETKEVAAARERIEIGMTTLEEETASLTGTTWESKVPQIRRERAILKEIGIAPTPRQNQTAANAPPDNTGDAGNTDNQP